MYYVYILTNKTNTTLYIGVTNNLTKRVRQHKKKLIDGFTKKYNLTKLVYVESTHNAFDAIQREKQLKKWRRSKKINLIKHQNPIWDDLSKMF